MKGNNEYPKKLQIKKEEGSLRRIILYFSNNVTTPKTTEGMSLLIVSGTQCSVVLSVPVRTDTAIFCGPWTVRSEWREQEEEEEGGGPEFQVASLKFFFCGIFYAQNKHLSAKQFLADQMRRSRRPNNTLVLSPPTGGAGDVLCEGRRVNILSIDN